MNDDFEMHSCPKCGFTDLMTVDDSLPRNRSNLMCTSCSWNGWDFSDPDKEKTIKVLDMIVQDMAKDAADFDGNPFNGKTVGEYLGHQGAAIAALANIIKQHLEIPK